MNRQLGSLLSVRAPYTRNAAAGKKADTIDLDGIQKTLHLSGDLGCQVLCPLHNRIGGRFVHSNRQIAIGIYAGDMPARRNAPHHRISQLQRIAHENPRVVQRGIHGVETLPPALHFAQIHTQFRKAEIRRIENGKAKLHVLAVLNQRLLYL